MGEEKQYNESLEYLIDYQEDDNLYTLQSKVRLWAEDRGIFEHSDAKTQCLKTVSEVGELADSVARGSDVKDDIGDVLVTLILLAKMKGTDLEECLRVAYSEICGRTGRMQNGTFVKDGG